MLFSILFACQPQAENGVLGIGDSMLAWNRESGESIPEVVATELGLDVLNASVSGSQLTDGGDEAIPNQYVDGAWDWVVLNGGGNDLNEQCGCGECDAVLDNIASVDGQSGTLSELVDEVSSKGHSVVIVGYFQIPEEQPDFGNCGDTLVELNARQQQVAETRDGVWFISSGDVVSPADMSHYDDDSLHPSVEGSAVIGQNIAETIQGLE